MILETQIVLVEFFLHSSKLYFIQLLRAEMNKRTVSNSFQNKIFLSIGKKKSLNNLWELFVIGFRTLPHCEFLLSHLAHVKGTQPSYFCSVCRNHMLVKSLAAPRDTQTLAH